MIITDKNPFEITKDVWLSDKEIENLWVDYPIKGGFKDLAKPKSTLPMLVLGGKGSGKTHLMRYYSFSLQKLRHESNLLDGIKKDGYLGNYTLAGGLNAKRFSGKGQSKKKWQSVFCFYMDLFLVQNLLTNVNELLEDNEGFNIEAEVCKEILDLFEVTKQPDITTLKGLIDYFNKLRNGISREVNNCIFSGELNVSILISPSKLIFGVPKILKRLVSDFKDITFLYIIDELENFEVEQQVYVNSLVRENKPPCSIKIGARLYGIKTYKTYSAEEEIKEGPEFEKLILDQEFRNKKKKSEYKRFAAHLCLKRINSNYKSFEGSNFEPIEALSKYFEQEKVLSNKSSQINRIRRKYPKSESRIHIKKLKRNLLKGLNSREIIGIKEQTDIFKILDNLSFPNHPILEKFNTFLFYKDWYQKENLLESSSTIKKECESFIKENLDQRYGNLFNRWKYEMLAQLLRENELKQRYFGVDNIIDMSDGLPRNLLMTMKYIYQWADFSREEPFQEGKISINSQVKGIKEASEWFFNDARPAGGQGKVVRDAISRLARMFREFRFSDKPSEVSLITFSTDLSNISEKSQEIIEIAVKWSLLIDIEGGHKEKNTAGISNKYQLSKMLSPRWDLPLSRRGTVELNADEINSIFDPDYNPKFEAVIKKRLSRLNAPFIENNSNELNLFDQ